MTQIGATMRRVFLAASILAAATASAQQPATAKAGPTLIKNATVLTVTKGKLESTDLLLQNGKIAQIGKNLTAPAGAQVIDATGKYVMPGIIDPHSHSMADAINEGSLSVTSMVRIHDVLNPTDVNIYRQLAGGVTSITVLHGPANTIGGQNAVVKLKWGRPVDEMVFTAAPPGIKFALGENVTQKNSQTAAQAQGRPLRYPATRMGQEEVLRDAFTRARDYKAAWDDYNAKVKTDKTAGPPGRALGPQ